MSTTAVPYFRISDDFHNHPKVLTAGNAAIGAYTRFGAYSSHYLLDGFIPRDVARAYGTRRELDRLIEAGLLLEISPEGLMIVHYAEHNWPAERVRAHRAAETERQRKWRQTSNGHAVTDAVPSRPPKPKPKPKSKKSSSSAPAVHPPPLIDGTAAAAAMELFITHKLHRDQPRSPTGYARKLRDELPGEYAAALERYTTEHPTASSHDIARHVFAMSVIDIRKTSVTP